MSKKKMERIHYISDSEVAELFDEDANKRHVHMAHLKNHPYFSSIFDEEELDVLDVFEGQEEDERFCNSFYYSRD